MTTRSYALALALALVVGTTAALAGLLSLALLAPVFAVVCVVWPRLGVSALIVACALDRFAIGVGANLRLDELAALALAGSLLVRALWRRAEGWRERRWRPPVPSERHPWRVGFPLLVPLVAYAGINLIAALAAAPDQLSRGLSYDLITLDLIVLYAAVVLGLRTPEGLLGAVRLWLGVAAVEAVIGTLCFALYSVTHRLIFGVQLAPDTGAPMVYGTLYEANIFGSYMSAAFLLALAMATDDATTRKAPHYLICALTALGLLLSATRSAWGATVVGAILLLGLLRWGVGRQGGQNRSRVALRFAGGLAVVAVVLGVGLAIAPASVSGQLGQRVQGLLNFGSGSGYGRVLLYTEALHEWQGSPWLGTGPGSFSYRLEGDTASGPAWLPNLTLQALHDTGVLGLLALLWLFVAFYITTLRALHRTPPGRLRAILAGLIAAVTALLISFQLTPGFLLGYSWALLGLSVAAAEVAMVATAAQPFPIAQDRRGTQQRGRTPPPRSTGHERVAPRSRPAAQTQGRSTYDAGRQNR